MEQYNTTIGMDLGDDYCDWALMIQESDAIQEEGRVRTTERALKAKFSVLAPLRVAMEAGTHSPWISRLLTACGHEVIVANPRKLRVIYTNEKKDDKVDARMLARIARLDVNLLAPIQHRGEQAQAHLALLHARDALVKIRTQLINHVRSVTKSFGHRLKSCSTASFHRQIEQESLPEALRPALAPLVDMIGQVTEKIRSYDVRIESLCQKEYGETELLREVSGVGPQTALAFVLTLESPECFLKSRDVGSYIGLTPRRDQSGQHDPQLGITKAGNPYLRRLLVGCAQYILGKLNPQDSELRQWGLRLAGPVNEKGKHNKRLKKRAVVAVARKLAVLLHSLWLNGTIFEPFYQRQLREAKGCPT